MALRSEIAVDAGTKLENIYFTNDLLQPLTTRREGARRKYCSLPSRGLPIAQYPMEGASCS